MLKVYIYFRKLPALHLSLSQALDANAQGLLNISMSQVCLFLIDFTELEVVEDKEMEHKTK